MDKQTLQMRPSRVLRKLRAGQVVSCVKTNLAEGRVAEIGGMTGFDCLWTCMEHVPNDWSAIEQQIWAAKIHDMDVMVRVTRGSYSDYIRPLELDAAGIMVPHVMSAEDARNVVRMTRFQPIGRRPIDGGNADGAFSQLDIGEYVKQANEQRFIVLQVEDPEPFDELDAIAAVEGYNMLLFGAGDFSHGIGVPGQMDDPRIIEARQRVAEVAAAHGKFAGIVAVGEQVPELVEMGYQFFNLAADVLSLASHWRQVIEQFNEQVS